MHFSCHCGILVPVAEVKCLPGIAAIMAQALGIFGALQNRSPIRVRCRVQVGVSPFNSIIAAARLSSSSWWWWSDSLKIQPIATPAVHWDVG